MGLYLGWRTQQKKRDWEYKKQRYKNLEVNLFNE